MEDTGSAQSLAAAVEAALKEANVEAMTRVAPVPPGEPLSPPRHVCDQAAQGMAGALSGGGLRALALAHEAAARAGLPLLLVDPAPLAASAQWEALQLRPHPDVFAQVRAARDVTPPRLSCYSLNQCLSAGVRGPVPREGLGERGAAARGWRWARGSPGTRRTPAGATGPAAAATRGGPLRTQVGGSITQ